MLTMKTAELIGISLDWAVAKANGTPNEFNYSTWWTYGGHIIERERISLRVDTRVGRWVAFLDGSEEASRMTGETPLIAAMRCYVASRLGDDVEIPEEIKQC